MFKMIKKKLMRRY